MCCGGKKTHLQATNVLWWKKNSKKSKKKPQKSDYHG